MKWAWLAMGLILAGASVFLMVEAGLLALEARIELNRAVPQAYELAQRADSALVDLRTIQTDTTRTEAEMAGLLNQTRHSLMTPAQTKELVDQAAATLSSLQSAADRLQSVEESLQGIAPTAEGAIAQTAQDLHQTAMQSQAMLKAATDDLDAPAIQGTEADAQQAAAEAAQTAKNVDAATADLAAWIHRETAPARGTWNVIKKILDEIAGPAASIATAVK